ncbi:MAG TPA: hypothetical protein DCS87_00205, partial [Rheinheimera sp.]|nr:hypothetical protein [Rheinheimera sp.]
AFKTARRLGKNHLDKMHNQHAKPKPAAGIPARRTGENHLEKKQNQHAKPRLPQAQPLAAKAKII